MRREFFSKFFELRSGKIFLAIFLSLFFLNSISYAEEDNKRKNFLDNLYSFENGGLRLSPPGNNDIQMTLGGTVIGRYAYWNWFEASSDNNEYNYGFQRTRLNLEFDSKYINIFIQPQYVHMFSLPDDAVSMAPRGPLGMGGLYYLHNSEQNPYRFGIHQAYLKIQNIFDQDMFLKGGCFEYSDGLEVLREKDGKKFNAVKKMRLADRMISSFGWSAFGRSFYGGLFSYSDDKFNLTSSFFYPTQGGWEKEMNKIIEDIRITTVTLTAEKDVLLPGLELAGFYYNYQDGRNVTQRVDNSGKLISADGVDVNVHMFGGRLLEVCKAGPGQLDIMFWGGFQFGTWYELDQQAFAIDGEIGYQLVEFPWKPWVRMGYFYGTGDDDSSDNLHGTFFQMAPGTRKYQLLPFCDLMNTQDLFFQIISNPFKNLTTRLEYHFIQLTESNDRWYMGSGPTKTKGSIFGYLARPTNGKDDLAQELDLILNYSINQQCNLIFSYSHVFGDDVISTIYSASDNADYLSLEMQVKF